MLADPAGLDDQTVAGELEGGEHVLLDQQNRQPDPVDLQQRLAQHLDRRGASPSDSSSIISSVGRDMMPRPIAHICCSPPDSVVASCRCRSLRIGNSV